MTYAVEYSKQAEKTLKKWKKSNPHMIVSFMIFMMSK